MSRQHFFCRSNGFRGSTSCDISVIVVFERVSFEIVESEIETLLAYGVLSCYFIASSAAIVSTPSHRFSRRRFSLAAC